MKYAISFLMIMSSWCLCNAEPGTSAKIQGVADPACISVSTSAWTAIPSTTTVKSGRGGILISAPSTNTAGFGIVLASSTMQVPIVSTSSFGIQMAKGDYLDLSISEFVRSFAVALHSSAESICYQEYTLELGR